MKKNLIIYLSILLVIIGNIIVREWITGNFNYHKKIDYIDYSLLKVCDDENVKNLLISDETQIIEMNQTFLFSDNEMMYLNIDNVNRYILEIFVGGLIIGIILILRRNDGQIETIFVK